MLNRIILILITISCSAFSVAGSVTGPATDTDGNYTINFSETGCAGSTYYLKENGSNVKLGSCSGNLTGTHNVANKPSGQFTYTLDICFYDYWIGTLCLSEFGPPFGPPLPTHTVTVSIAAPPPPETPNYDPAITAPDTPGSLPYAAGVSDDGLASIAVPIKLPPGVNGLTPALSINFDSGFKAQSEERQWGHSLLGDGWFLSGLSSLRRCQQQVANPPALALNSNDRLCLDGIPLVLISGSYWNSGSVYHTENETFTKVTLSSSSGVYSFDVRTADGRILTYGGSNNDAIVKANGVAYEWALVNESDRFGNTIVYDYYNLGNGEYFPKQIEYDGTVVSFNYQQRPSNSVPSFTIAGQSIDRSVNVSRINVSAMGIPSREYRLSSQVANNSVRLQAIQECGFEQGANISCMAPLLFDWYVSGGRAAVDSVVDGLGAETLFNYATSLLTESSFPNYRNLTATSCGLTTQSSNRLYARTLSQSNGRGGYNSWTYKAQSAPLFSTTGRGYAGHANIMVTDNQQSHRSYIHHWQCFPYTQQVAAAYSYTGAWSSSQALAKEEIRWVSTSLHSGKTQFAYAQKSTSLGYEAGVQFGFSETSTAFTFSNWLPTSTVSTTTAADRSTLSGNNWVPITVQKRLSATSNYANNASSWLIGFVNRVDVQHKDIPGESNSAVLTTNFTQQAGTLAVNTSSRFTGTNLNVVTDFNYLSNGNLSTIEVSGNGFNTRQVSFSGYLDNRYPGTITNAMGHVENAAYDRRFGVISQRVSATQETINNTFDQFGRPIHSDSSSGQYSQISYLDCSAGCPSSVGPHVPVYRVEINDPAYPNRKTYYDQVNRVIRTEIAAFSATDGYSKVDVHYDVLGRVEKQSLPYFSGTPKYVTTAYDNLGRILTQTRPDGGSTTYTYTLNSSSSPSKFRIKTTETIVTPDSAEATQKAQSVFNSLGQLTKKIDALVSNQEVTTIYDYNIYGNLNFTQVNGDISTITTTTFDWAGNQLSITEPNTGTTNFESDSLGQLLHKTDARGVTTQFSYDLIGRVTQRIDGAVNGQAAVTNTLLYKEGSPQLENSYNDADIPVHESFYYAGNRLALATVMVGNRSLEKEYFYNSFGRPSRIEYGISAGGPSVHVEAKQEYNAQGYLSAVRNNWTNEILHQVSAVDAFGNVTQELFGNGVTTSKTYDGSSGRLTGINTSNGIQNSAYSWRSNGVLKSRSKGSIVEDFNYDQLNRIINSTSSIPGTDRSLSYDYDLLGNINFKTSNISGDVDATSYVYGNTANAGPHAVSQVNLNGVTNNLNYDPVGNVTSIVSSTKTRNVTYDANNKATKIELFTGSSNSPDVVEEFRYGPNLARYFKSATYPKYGQDETYQTYYAFGGEIEYNQSVTDPSNDFNVKFQVSPNVQWVHAFDGNVTHTQWINYLHRDHLGSVEALSNESGTVRTMRAYDPFGGRREVDWSSEASQATIDDILNILYIDTSRGYTGHEHLDRTGIIHMNGRIYDPEIGRFLNADPIVQAPGYSQSYNRYAYVYNSPLSFTDPSGYEPDPGTQETNRSGYALRGLYLSGSCQWLCFDAETEMASGELAGLDPGLAIGDLRRTNGEIAGLNGLTGCFEVGCNYADRQNNGRTLKEGLIALDQFWCDINAICQALLLSERERNGELISHDEKAAVMFGMVGPGRGPFKNRLGNRLAAELAIANRIGFKAVEIGSSSFPALVNQGTIKFVVTKSGKLIAGPHSIGGQEISHAVLSRGQAVVSAGQAEIAYAGGKYFGISINNHSGHFIPTLESLNKATKIFADYGIKF